MELWLIGTILKPKGLKGELKVQPVTDFPDRFLSRTKYFAGRQPETVVPVNVKSATLSQGFAWLFFEGVDSREKAQEMAGMHLYIEEKECAPRPQNRAWLHELEGMRVKGRDGVEVGVLTAILPMPAHEVYEVRTGNGTVLIPAIDEFIDEISLEGGYIVVPRFDEFL
ncbi:ribosome maturation factor RimM [Chlorobium phaeovibrioides]|uniref:Ribosome maturation factor RimM n=1 Tax=Chlorobium phaeovibrioides TaxID=1094 RepID=A0ABW9UQM2_CHLPH|nr:ribosome maturation factor RimM [Chlorobium phaeovibrioides]MWV54542.1 16S rRNA processing protein RimM [Chlorobium phaeovibrioides]